MNEISPDYFIAACFLVFVYLTYKPIKSYLAKILEGNINDLCRTIDEANNIVSDARKVLLETQGKLNNFDEYKNTKLIKAKQVNDAAFSHNKAEYGYLLERKKAYFLAEITTQKQLVNQRINADYIDVAINIAKIYCIQTQNNHVSDVNIAKILGAEAKS